jgi:Arc/MetJ family transcription regulator
MMTKQSSVDVRSIQGQAAMRTTINLDDKLLEEARRMTGMEERTALIHEGLRALIARESARRLARLGGTQRRARAPRRRRSA